MGGADQRIGIIIWVDGRSALLVLASSSRYVIIHQRFRKAICFWKDAKSIRPIHQSVELVFFILRRVLRGTCRRSPSLRIPSRSRSELLPIPGWHRVWSYPYRGDQHKSAGFGGLMIAGRVFKIASRAGVELPAVVNRGIRVGLAPSTCDSRQRACSPGCPLFPPGSTFKGRIRRRRGIWCFHRFSGTDSRQEQAQSDYHWVHLQIGNADGHTGWVIRFHGLTNSLFTWTYAQISWVNGNVFSDTPFSRNRTKGSEQSFAFGLLMSTTNTSQGFPGDAVSSSKVYRRKIFIAKSYKAT